MIWNTTEAVLFSELSSIDTDTYLGKSFQLYYPSPHPPYNKQTYIECVNSFYKPDNVFGARNIEMI